MARVRAAQARKAAAAGEDSDGFFPCESQKGHTHSADGRLTVGEARQREPAGYPFRPRSRLEWPWRGSIDSDGVVDGRKNMVGGRRRPASGGDTNGDNNVAGLMRTGSAFPVCSAAKLRPPCSQRSGSGV